MRQFTLASVSILAAAWVGAALPVNAAPGGHNRNDVGADPDPDGDTNPATISTLRRTTIGDAAEAAYDKNYTIITFDPPPPPKVVHNAVIRKQYEKKYGVTFSRGLNWQICEGQRYFEYDTKCTYLRGPSGDFAAVYGDEFNRPLRIRFAKPVCAAAVEIYPTGGEEGEEFEITLQPYDDDDNELNAAWLKLKWTQDTFRWRHAAHAYFLDTPASRVDVSIRSLKNGNQHKQVQFLIDDLAFISDDPQSTDPEQANKCQMALDDIKDKAGSIHNIFPANADLDDPYGDDREDYDDEFND